MVSIVCASFDLRAYCCNVLLLLENKTRPDGAFPPLLFLVFVASLGISPWPPVCPVNRDSPILTQGKTAATTGVGVKMFEARSH